MATIARNNENIVLGSYVVCNGLMYTYTNMFALCEVVDILDNDYEDIEVEIIAHLKEHYKNQIGESYSVNSDNFHIVTREELELFKEMFPELEIDLDDTSRKNTDIETPTVMNKSWTVPMSDEYFEKEKRWAKDLLNEFDYSYSNYALDKIIHLWHENKQWMEVLFSKHPDWDPEHKMIVFKRDILRTRDQKGIIEACDWIKEKIREQYNVGEKLRNGEVNRGDVHYCWCMYSLIKDYDIINAKMEAVNLLLYTKQMVENEWVNNFNYLLRKLNIPKWNIHTGQKASRIFTRFCKEIGIKQDDEFNKKQALYGDSINPCNQTFWVCISINLIDYWTMSFGKNWASCHTIDKENVRRGNGNYSGCYSSGTESYMLDPSTVIMYTVLVNDKFRYDHDERDFMFANKHRRCVFYIGEDKIIQSRVYPDGRDGGEEGIGKTFREIFEEVISTCLGVENKWKYVGGTSTASNMIEDYGTHYRDYRSYSDVGTAFLKRKGVLKNKKSIIVGHDPICPDCGNTHDFEDNILCRSCAGEYDYFCDQCGEGINSEIDDYVRVDDHYFCCSDCVEMYGYRYCYNIDEWIYEDDEYLFRDENTGEYFYDSDGDHIVTEDGCDYMNEYNASHDGYREEHVTGEWVCEDELYYCHNCGHWFYENNFDMEHNCCNDCAMEIINTNAELDSVSA